MPAAEEWLERIAGIRQWSRNGERAPHKPLLLLYALGRLQRTGTTEMTYADAEPALEQLLRDFGPPGRRSSPAYPFHHLQTDGLWSVMAPGGSAPGSSRTQLRDTGRRGGSSPTRRRRARLPGAGQDPPSPRHVEWHHRQVFSGPARVPA